MTKRKQPRASANPYRGAGKAPVAVEQTARQKVPTAAAPLPADENTRHIRFRFQFVDHDGPWALSRITPADHAELLRFLAEIEKQTVGELFGRPTDLCKLYPDMGKCPNGQVKARLAAEYEGNNSMVRLRLTGTKRLYGFRQGHEFHVIWWDPTHDIWPSIKRHT